MARFGAIDPGAFLPRATYGQYVAATLDAAVENAPAQAIFTRVRDEVVAVTSTPARQRLRLESGNCIVADRVVLSLGSGPPRVPAPVSALSADRVIVTPFAAGALDCVGEAERLLVLGTGLTMYDAMISLARRGFRGEVIALSRRGRTPAAHQQHDSPPWVAAWSAGLACLTTSSALLRTVHDALRRAERAGADWRAVIDAMRPHLPRIWAGLPTVERARFLHRLAPFWEVARHRCAPEVASEIALLRDRGALHIRAGRLEACSMQRGRIAASILMRGAAAAATERFDRVLVCAGPETDVTRWRSPLMEHLLAHGLVAPDALRLGLRTTPDGLAIGTDGKASEWLRVVGPLRKAELWESTAVPELRVQASISP